MEEPTKKEKDFEEHVRARYWQGNFCPMMQGFVSQAICDQVADPLHIKCRECPRRQVSQA